MAETTRTPAAPTPAGATPDHSRRIAALLGRQQRRIARRFLFHGLGWVLGVMAAVALVYYLADRSLRLPAGVRVLLSAGAVAYVVLVVRRRLLYPLSRRFSRTDVAVALERRFPELHQKLVSAFQLQDLVADRQTDPGPATEGRDPFRNQSPEMIREVVAQAAAESAALPVQKVLDPRRTFRVWGLAACVLLIGITGAIANPEAAGVFAQRFFGLSVPYPRNTILRVELPPNSSELRTAVFQDEGRAEVTMATGADLTVIVTADGTIPAEVLLRTSGSRGGSREVAMTSRGAGRFRYVFRRVPQDFEFHASGGDDDTGDLRVRVFTISPPGVAGIRATLHQPAYTGNPVEVQTGGTIEALEDTRVDLAVTATADVERATLTFMDSGERIELDPVRMEDDSGQTVAYTGSFRVTASDRYQVELLGTTGLRNPHPGSYTLTALRDYPPTGHFLNPGDDPLAVTVPQGALPIRIVARDDFGLQGATVNVLLSRTIHEETDLDLLGARSPGREETVLTRVSDVAGLVSGSVVSIGESIGLTVELTDNREPDAQATPLPRREVFVVEEADLVRRIAGHFRRIRVQALDAQGRQGDGADRLASLIEELEEGLQSDRAQSTLLAIELSQARVQGASGSMLEEFMRSFDLHLFNRLEPSIHAEQVLEMYQTWHQANPDPRPYVPAFYRMLDLARRESRLGAMEIKLDPILSMVMRADKLFHDLAPEATDLIKVAQSTDSGTDRLDALRKASTVQLQIAAELDALVALLDKWNEFQDVIDETRDLRDKQQDVHVRTRTIRGGGPAPRPGKQ